MWRDSFKVQSGLAAVAGSTTPASRSSDPCYPISSQALSTSSNSMFVHVQGHSLRGTRTTGASLQSLSFSQRIARFHGVWSSKKWTRRSKSTTQKSWSWITLRLPARFLFQVTSGTIGWRTLRFKIWSFPGWAGLREVGLSRASRWLRHEILGSTLRKHSLNTCSRPQINVCQPWLSLAVMN